MQLQGVNAVILSISVVRGHTVYSHSIDISSIQMRQCAEGRQPLASHPEANLAILSLV